MPALPAILIYKMAPGAEVAVSGPLSKLSIRATGAIGAYIIFSLLGGFVIVEALKIINTISYPTIKVQAEVRFRDENQKEIKDSVALSTIDISIRPPVTDVNGSFFNI